MSEEPRLRIGVSSCLLGEEVRYDGGHKREAVLVEVLGREVEWVPVCPEVEIGLGTPRPPMNLVRIGGETRLITAETGADHTAAMRSYAERRVEELAGERLAGYIFKKDSPSCGLDRVKLYPAAGGDPTREARGLFAEALVRRFPDLPVEEEDGLRDPVRRERFLSRVRSHREG
ncbi:MAG TPA: DUF523 domain-containing protein [Thermoanaerobaculia bacterium]|nr:DUF523 domain-containing protein [Thermoanaerobaculia bacterium]